MTCTILRSSQSALDSATMDSFECLLEGWLALSELPVDPPPDAVAAVQTLQPYAAEIYKAYIEARMRMSQASAEDDEDDLVRVLVVCGRCFSCVVVSPQFADEASVLQDQLAGVATLGRMCIEPACTYLTQLLAMCLQSLTASVNGTADSRQSAVLFEQSGWLVRLASHLLTDAAEGETPVIPKEVAALSYRQAEVCAWVLW